ncbi:MAG: cell division protein FtsX [Candidatus Kapaibacterium sp.]
MFILRETVRFLRHHAAAWLMSVLTLGVALGIGGLFALLAWKAHTAMTAMRSNLAIEAFFDPSVSSEDASAIAKEKIDPLAGIAKVTFISKEQALTDYSNMSGENVESVLGMNPLPASVKLYLADPTAQSAEALEATLRAVPEVQDVRGNFPLLRAMESRSHALNRIAILAGSLLLLSAFFYALLAGQHSFEISNETLHTFRLLGATRVAAAAPIIITSTLAGIAAGLMGSGLLLLVHAQILTIASDVFPFSLAHREILFAIGSLVVVGGAVGACGAIASAGLRKR